MHPATVGPLRWLERGGTLSHSEADPGEGRFLAPAWAVLTHSHARASEGYSQSDLYWAEVAFVLFGHQIRSDK